MEPVFREVRTLLWRISTIRNFGKSFFRVSFEIDIQKVFEQKSNLSSLEMGSRFSSRNSPLVLEKNKLFREKMFGVKQVKQAWVKQNNSSSNP